MSGYFLCAMSNVTQSGRSSETSRPLPGVTASFGIDALCARSGGKRLRNVGSLHLEDGKRIVNHSEYDVEPLIMHEERGRS